MNIFEGAVRSGKTVLSFFYIPMLLEMFPNGKGIIIGKTLAALDSNILEPMRELYGYKFVSDVRTLSSGVKYVTIFGRDVRCVGANDKRSEGKIRGSTYAWAIGDEVTLWDKAVMDMLVSRLSEKGAVGVYTTNTDSPAHWFKKHYIDNDKIDKAVYSFGIDDNPTLDPDYVADLKKTYEGTELYDRFILGKWASGYGSIYKNFIINKNKLVLQAACSKDYVDYAIGIDFGESRSATTFCLLGLKRNYSGITVLEEGYITDHGTVEKVQEQFIAFLRKCIDRGYYPTRAYYDCAQVTLGESLRYAAAQKGFGIIVKPCIKEKIKERVQQGIALFGRGMLEICQHCKHTIEAFETAVWSDTEERLDDFTSNIDSIDATEYAWQAWAKNLMMICLNREY